MYNITVCVYVCVCEGNMDGGPPFRLPYLISLKILISQAAAESRAELCNDHQPIQLFLYTRHTQPSASSQPGQGGFSDFM